MRRASGARVSGRGLFPFRYDVRFRTRICGGGQVDTAWAVVSYENNVFRETEIGRGVALFYLEICLEV
jgi:hypothetical protein